MPAGTEGAPPVGERAARLGPLVHRSVHHGAAVWVAAVVQFVLVMIVVQMMFTPSYSLSANVISDLGNTACGNWPSSTSHHVCSPWHDVFNISVIAFGLLIVLGAVLVKSAFPNRRSSSIGLGGLALSGIGAIGVGIFPENVNLGFHEVFAAIAFVIGNLALVVLGFAMFRDTRWDGYRAYTMFSGLFGLVAFLLYVTQVYLGLGPGGMERLVAAPLLVWAFVSGAHLLRVPAYARTVIPHSMGN
ncbi:MAG TPA: DUF998 domain-containing protein [Thermoplasmata archaeon]|nr:DUF998 domain-containing protein [Thermoplasmata archaeon]